MNRLLLALTLLVGLGCGAAAPKPPEVRLDIKDFDGVMALVKSHQGKVVVMDAWSTSCEPCMKEFPGLVALHKKYGSDKVACISLSLDYIGLGKPEDQAPQVLKFLREQGATFDNVLSSDDSDTLLARLKLPSIPAVFIYDRQGQLHKRLENEFSYRDVEPIVAELLK